MQRTWTHSRDRELTRLQLRSNALVRKVESWYAVLQLYIPSTFTLRQEAISEKTVAPYDLSLWLPSAIGNRAPVERRLVDIEYKLRSAQASEALVNLRRHLQRRVTVYDARKRWVRGQGANTRALNLLESVEERITTSKEEYRRSRRALLNLGGMLGIKGLERSFPPLLDGDVKALSRPQLESASAGQTTAVLSWIWRHSSVTDDDHSAFEAESMWWFDSRGNPALILPTGIKVEWAKSRARAARYQEEIKIVGEEMKRSLRFLDWRVNQWRIRGEAKGRAGESDESYLAGLKAYALRQAAICEGLKRLFSNQWSGVKDMVSRAQQECDSADIFYARRHGTESEPVPPSV